MTLLSIVAYTIIILYNLCLAFTMIYCVMQLHLLYLYRKNRNQKTVVGNSGSDTLPFITVQLPLYNEKYVVERLIDNIVQLEYPTDKLEIQILDDSTDDTLEISKAAAAKYRQQGIDVKVVTREDRQGFKAGALAYGLKEAKGELIAIFDADFLPTPDFLLRCLPHLKPDVAVVQTRWSHINENYSLLTRLQAFQLNVHFTSEQHGRWSDGLMLQFNGTAGIWRREAIEDAGGWNADTLTEDLDLSYRAQLKGWKIVYREDVASPSELPVEMAGLKSQQHRWMKGGAESARKLLASVWRSQLSLYQKVHASMHLLSSTVYVAAFALGILSVPMLFVEEMGVAFDDSYMIVFLSSTISLAIVYFHANVVRVWKETSLLKKLVKYLLIFPVFLALSMGLSLHNSVAVIQGYLGRKSAFIRTPKFNIIGSNRAKKTVGYRDTKLSSITLGEGLLALYFLGAIIYQIYTGDTAHLAFHIVFFFGYLVIFWMTVRELRAVRK